MVRDPARAEDIAQDAFCAALRRMRATDAEIAFKPWIFEIARNAAIDHWRRTSRAEEISVDEDERLRQSDRVRLTGAAGPDSVLVEKERFEHLRGAFDELSEVHTRILVLRELEGLSYREIAERLELTESSVQSALFRARRRLESEYADISEGRRCVAMRSVMGRMAEGLGDKREAGRLARHARRCHVCRRRARELGVDLVPPLTRLRRKAAALLPLPLVPRRAATVSSGAAGGGEGAGGAFGLLPAGAEVGALVAERPRPSWRSPRWPAREEWRWAAPSTDGDREHEAGARGRAARTSAPGQKGTPAAPRPRAGTPNRVARRGGTPAGARPAAARSGRRASAAGAERSGRAGRRGCSRCPKRPPGCRQPGRRRRRPAAPVRSRTCRRRSAPARRADRPRPEPARTTQPAERPGAPGARGAARPRRAWSRRRPHPSSRPPCRTCRPWTPASRPTPSRRSARGNLRADGREAEPLRGDDSFLEGLMDTSLYSMGAYFSDQHPDLVDEVIAESEAIESAGLRAYADEHDMPIESCFETLLTGLAVRYYNAVAA